MTEKFRILSTKTIDSCHGGGLIMKKVFITISVITLVAFALLSTTDFNLTYAEEVNEPNDYFELFVQAPDSWDNLYVWAWSELDQTQYSSEMPGLMADYDNAIEYYKLELPKWITHLYFHDGANQITETIQLENRIDIMIFISEINDDDLFNTNIIYLEPILPTNSDFEYAQGYYDFKFASPEVKHIFFGAAERWLLDTMAGGVPLYSNSRYSMYSDRIQLPVEEYIPIMGYGIDFATMSLDDSHVIMDDGQPGNPGEYTYRTYFSSTPDTFNQWHAANAISSDSIKLFLDSLYYFDFNEDQSGFALLPSMASDFPQPVDLQVILGTEASHIWRVPLRTDLMWTYHPDTDTSEFPAGHESITAHDFIATFKLALEEGWFRAVSGGGDFISNGILNAAAYRDGDVAWEAVGLIAIDDYTLEFEFESPKSEWHVRYWLSSNVMAPINLHLFEKVGYAYGTSASTIASNGRFRLDVYEPDHILRYSENPNFHSPERTFFTGYSIRILVDHSIALAEFLAGRLDVSVVPVANFEDYKEDSNVKTSLGTTTFRMVINGLGSLENQQNQFPSSQYIPKPILGYEDFRRAMYFAIDRETLSDDVLKTFSPQQFLFTDAHVVDGAYGIEFRNTPQGELVGEGLFPSTFGYNPEIARALYKSALEQAISDGHYAPGTIENPTIIELDLLIMGGTSSFLLGEFLKDTLETLFIDEDYHIQIAINVITKGFPQIYNYLMSGEFDLGIGGISGGTLDAAGFLRQFRSDNAGGFTLSWGVDTNTPEIPVEYTINGILFKEIWSFDAIHRALTEGVYVEDGMETEVSEE